MNDLFSEYDIIGVLYELGAVRPLDRSFAAFILREETAEQRRLISVLAGVVSYATTAGNNVCLPLAELEAFLKTMYNETEVKRREQYREVCEDILALLAGVDLSTVFAGSRTVAVAPEEGEEVRPLVFSGGRLYLWRYWVAEEVVVGEIRKRVAETAGGMLPDELPPLAEVYRRFADLATTWWQQVAVFTALRAKFSVITGGPGTGKTTVVAVILALYFQQNPRDRVVLAAPTGKAQARLKEAVFAELEYLNISTAVRESILAVEFKTVHSLLGITRTGQRRIRELRYDLVIVDEASMVSILLFQALFAALSASVSLVLLGDRDQLAAVDGGAVLSDICSSVVAPGRFSGVFLEDLARYLPTIAGFPEEAKKPVLLQDVIAPLEHTFRFAANSGIGRLKDLLSAEPEQIAGFLEEGYISYSETLGITEFASPLASARLHELWSFILNWRTDNAGGTLRYLDYREKADIATAFAAYSEFQIITALNKGLLGVEGINNMLLQVLGMQLAGSKGLPVIIERNDYQNMLFNGDIGMFWPDSAGKLKVWFPESTVENGSAERRFRAFSPAKLPPYSPAFAMTTHKAQGSGFGSVLLVLPAVDSVILTRELLYTAVTRAKRRIDIFAEKSCIVTASNKRVCRISALEDKLS